MHGMKTERRMLVVVVLAAWCCLVLAAEAADGGGGGEGGGGEIANQQPHVVLIVADDLGWNDMPWHNQEVLAPNLESLARGGVILSQSYVQPLCTPSRSALLSGRYPFTIGRQHEAPLPEEPTGLDLSLTILPQAMKAVGYETHIVGKWHLGFCSWDYTPTNRGFDTFYGFYVDDEDYYQHTRETELTREGQEATYHGKAPWAPCKDLASDFDTHEERGLAYLDLRNNTEADWNKAGVYSTYIYASEVETILTARDPQVPLFLYLPFQSVHFPLQVPEQYEEPFSHILDPNRRTYLGMVSAMDEAVGRVVDALIDTGHYNNTLIVFTTDNGGSTAHGGNNWPLRGSKSTLWEGGTRGPAFVHSPLLPNPGTTNTDLIHITDWMPTLLGLAGGEVPEGIDGVDQWEALTGVAPSSRTELVYNIDNTTEFIAGVRQGKYKLLVGNPGLGERTPPPEDTKKVPIRKNEASGEDEIPAAADGEGQEQNELEEEEDEGQAEEKIIRVSDFVGRTRRLLEDITGRNASEIRLYDLENDPEEQYNVAEAHTDLVEALVYLLHTHLERYTPADVPDMTPAADPSNFGGVWSPGWC